MAGVGVIIPPPTVETDIIPTATIDTAIGKADAAYNTALGYLGDLVAVAGTLTAPVITPVFPDAIAAPALEAPEAPTVDVPVWVAPGLPAEFTELLDVTDLDVQPFDDNPPALVLGSAPAFTDETLPTAPPIDLAFTDPSLSVALPAAPDLLSISVSNFSGLNMPTFSTAEPTLDLVAPSIREYTPGTQYSSALLTALKTSLEDRLTNGGTGLAPDVENAIWDRGREREARSARDAIADLERMERLGFAFPPGAYLDARTKIQTEMDYANRGHSREVMIKAAELELDNVKHALTTATTLESQLIEANNQVEQRVFESCKYATEAGIAIYNAKVQTYQALVEVYRTKVQIYEAQVRAEISKVDAYRATIDAERAKAEVNTALVQQYDIKVRAALSAIDIYRAQIDGIKAKADIERAKIEVYGEQVRAYAARVNAYTAQVEGFRATLEGEKTKADIYSSQVAAFRTRVEAAARQVEARVAAYRGRIDASNARWDAYKAQSQAEASRVQSLAATNNAVADIYRAQVTGTSSFNEVLTKQWQVAYEQTGRTAEIAVKAAEANGQLYISSRSLISDATKISAQVAGQLAAAAINTYNFSDSRSLGVSSSVSNSYSQSNSQSWSNSYSENHNFSN